MTEDATRQGTDTIFLTIIIRAWRGKLGLLDCVFMAAFSGVFWSFRGKELAIKHLGFWSSVGLTTRRLQMIYHGSKCHFYHVQKHFPFLENQAIVHCPLFLYSRTQNTNLFVYFFGRNAWNASIYGLMQNFGRRINSLVLEKRKVTNISLLTVYTRWSFSDVRGREFFNISWNHFSRMTKWQNKFIGAGLFLGKVSETSLEVLTISFSFLKVLKITHTSLII